MLNENKMTIVLTSFVSVKCISLVLTGEVIKSNDLKCILGEGMPIYRDPFTKGRLIIKFNVIFPEKGGVPVNKLTELEKCLPPRQEVIIPDGAEEHMLEDFDPEAERTRRRMEAFDEDEDGPHGQRVQCASH